MNRKEYGRIWFPSIWDHLTVFYAFVSLIWILSCFNVISTYNDGINIDCQSGEDGQGSQPWKNHPQVVLPFHFRKLVSLRSRQREFVLLKPNGKRDYVVLMSLVVALGVSIRVALLVLPTAIISDIRRKRLPMILQKNRLTWSSAMSPVMKVFTNQYRGRGSDTHVFLEMCCLFLTFSQMHNLDAYLRENLVVTGSGPNFAFDSPRYQQPVVRYSEVDDHGNATEFRCFLSMTPTAFASYFCAMIAYVALGAWMVFQALLTVYDLGRNSRLRHHHRLELATLSEWACSNLNRGDFEVVQMIGHVMTEKEFVQFLQQLKSFEGKTNDQKIVEELV